MDKVIPDLGEPIQKALVSKEELAHKKWHFALTFYAAAMLYAFVHKVAVPLSLQYLGTSRIEYTHVSFGVLWILILGYTLHKEQEVSTRVQLFMGASAGFAFWELGLLFVQSHSGWMLFSHLLAAIPLLFAIINLLKFAEKRNWGLLFSGLLVYVVTEWILLK